MDVQLETQEQEELVESPPADAEIPAETVEATDAADVTSGGEGGPDVVSGIDEELSALAKGYGLDPQSFGNDPERVRHAVSLFDRQLAEFGRSLLNPGQSAAKPLDAPKTEPAAPGFDLDKLLGPDLDPNEYDEKIVARDKAQRAALKALNEHHAQQVAAIKDDVGKTYGQRFEAMERLFQQQEAERFEQQVDGFFGTLGKEWESEFGKGGVKALPPHSPLVRARNEVVMEAMALEAGYRNYSMQPPPRNELLKRALASRYSDKHTTFTRQQLLHEAQANKAKASAGAAGKRAAPPSGREKAAATLREGLRQLHG